MEKSTRSKWLKAGMILSAVISIIIAFSDYIMIQAIKLLFRVEAPKDAASSIGIIGGADGPTAIFLSNNQNPNYKYIWMFAFIIISTIFFILLKRQDSRK